MKNNRHQTSEDFSKLLLHSTKEGIWSIGLDGQITFVNKAAVQLLGYQSAEQMIGRDCHGLVHYKRADGSPYPQSECPIYEALLSGKSVHLENEVLWRADGSCFYAEYRSVPIYENSQIIGAAVTFTDITEKKKIQEELELNRAWLSATLKSIGDAVITIDASSPPQITFLNPVAESLTGWRLQEAKGKPASDVLKLETDRLLISRTGDEHLVEQSASPIKNEQGQIEGMVLVFRDLTEKQRHEERVLHLQADICQRTSEIQNARREAEIERAKLERIFEQVPIPLAMLEGPEHRYVFANSCYSQSLFGGKELVGSKVAEAGPGYIPNGLLALLDYVYHTGTRHVGKETPLELVQASGLKKKFYLDFVFEPTRNARGEIQGVLIAATDMTEQVTARERIKESESYFRDLVDMSPAMIWMTDEQSRCIYLSKQWYEFTGRRPEQDLGFGWIENIHPEDRPKTQELYTTAMSNKGLLHIDYRLRHHSDGYRWMVDSGHPRFDASGQFVGYIGTVVDVHDRLVAEHQVKEIQNRFVRSAEAMDLGIWYCDLPSFVMNWSREVKNHFFLPTDAEVTFQTFEERIYPEDKKKTRLAMTEAIANHTTYDVIVRTANPLDASEIKFIRAIGWADYDENGAPKSFDGITLDVTRQLRAQVELREAKEAAEAASAAKTAFLANMSHEIRTPLGAILGFTELLQDPALSRPEREQFLDTISRNGKALTRIIDDILDLAKVEAGKLEIEDVEFSFSELVAEVVNLFEEKAKAKGITMAIERAGPVPERIFSDPTRIRQILINIIGNAVKFTREGGIRVQIKSSPESDARIRLFIAVQDTGVGLAEDQVERLFKPFVQADNTTARKFGGTGLGLALSQRLAKALGGDITVENCRQNEGCTFVVSFFARPVGESQNKVVSSTRSAEDTSVRSPLTGVKVLVADDSVDNQFLVRRLLTLNGALVDTVNNGAEAFRAAMKNSYDIILMDIQMPEMDGYEATWSLREAGYKRPIVALTAHAMAEERARTRAAGCDGHLTKPLDRGELLAMIKKFQRPIANDELEEHMHE